VALVPTLAGVAAGFEARAARLGPGARPRSACGVRPSPQLLPGLPGEIRTLHALRLDWGASPRTSWEPGAVEAVQKVATGLLLRTDHLRGRRRGPP